MKVTLRPGTIEDAEECGRINYEAFKSIADQHNFPPDFPSAEIATEVTTMLLSHSKFYSVVAELDGKIVGSNFLDERSTIAAIGPVSVDPPVMNSTIGRQLMQALWTGRANSAFRACACCKSPGTTVRWLFTPSLASTRAKRSLPFYTDAFCC